MTKNTINKVKRQLSNWKKILAPYITDEELIFLVCKEFLNIVTKHQKNQNQKKTNNKQKNPVKVNRKKRWTIHTQKRCKKGP